MTGKQRRQRAFSEAIDRYFRTRRNKRYGRDQIAYELSWTARTLRMERRKDARTFRIDHNYAFLTSVPRWREIFATSFEGRMADHEVCNALEPFTERVLHPMTFNNRKGMGVQAAVNQLIEHIAEASDGYTRQAWIIKTDIKGFFPSARWDVAERFLERLVDDNREELECGREAGYADYLKWLTMVCINANPAAHCERRTPRRLWREHIDPEKSLFCKPEGTGAAIGRLIWQTAMGLYVNDEVRWLCDDCGVRVVCFVDDIVMVVPDRMKDYALGLLPELRRRLAVKGLKLNERKFYCQPYGHGVEFLGTHIKPYRLHLNDATFSRALRRIKTETVTSPADAREVLAAVNSYAGLLKNRTERRRLADFGRMVAEKWSKWIKWNNERGCAQLLDGKRTPGRQFKRVCEQQE